MQAICQLAIQLQMKTLQEKDDVTNSVSNFLNSADETGKCDNEELANAYDGTGISKEEAIQRVEILKQLQTMKEIGVSINVADLANMTAAQLDSVVESAIVQDVIKSTSTKVMGSAVNISSKKKCKKIQKQQAISLIAQMHLTATTMQMM